MFSYFFQMNFQIIIYLIKIWGGGLAPPQTEGGKILGGLAPPQAPTTDRLCAYLTYITSYFIFVEDFLVHSILSYYLNFLNLKFSFFNYFSSSPGN